MCVHICETTNTVNFGGKSKIFNKKNYNFYRSLNRLDAISWVMPWALYGKQITHLCTCDLIAFLASRIQYDLRNCDGPPCNVSLWACWMTSSANLDPFGSIMGCFSLCGSFELWSRPSTRRMPSLSYTGYNSANFLLGFGSLLLRNSAMSLENDFFVMILNVFHFGPMQLLAAQPFLSEIRFLNYPPPS